MNMSADEIIQALAHHKAEFGVKLGKMFGLRCLLLQRRPLVVLSGHELVFRLPADQTTEALRVPGAYAWEPMPGRGRMKEWIVIPVSTIDAAACWAEQSLEYVSRMKQ